MGKTPMMLHTRREPRVSGGNDSGVLVLRKNDWPAGFYAEGGRRTGRGLFADCPAGRRNSRNPESDHGIEF